MEAKKESARHAQQVLFKTPKEKRHAKNVQSTRISLKKASHRKRIAKNVPRKNQLEKTLVTSKSQHASAGERTFTKA